MSEREGERQATEQKPVEQQSIARKLVEQKPSEKKAGEQKPPERKLVEQKPPENFKETALRYLKALNSPIGFLVGFLGLLVAVVGLLVTIAVLYFQAIESRVKELVKDSKFVEKVARRARPAMVFDADRRLLADSGAHRFLEGVPEVELNVKDETVKTKPPHTFTRIVVRPKIPLASAPIVEALDSGDVSVKAQQIAGIAWEVRIEDRATLMSTEGSPPLNLAPYRYRLEIIPPSEAP